MEPPIIGGTHGGPDGLPPTRVRRGAVMEQSGPKQVAGVSSFTMKWKSSVSKSAPSMPEPVRVEALRALADCCNHPEHKEELWREVETRQALLSCAELGQPDVLRRIALAAMASLADAPSNQHWIWQECRSAIVAGARENENEGVRRQALWCVVNLSLAVAETGVDGDMDVESLWLDDAEDGAREIMQRSARPGQPEDLRLLAMWGLTNLAGNPDHRRSMWDDEATRAALLCCAEAGQPDLVRMQALRTLLSLATDEAIRCGLSDMWTDHHRREGAQFRAVLAAAASDPSVVAHEPGKHLLRVLQIPDAEVKLMIEAQAPAAPRVGAVRFAIVDADKDDAPSESSSARAASTTSPASEPTGGDQRDDSSSRKAGSHDSSCRKVGSYDSSGKKAGSFGGQSNERQDSSSSKHEVASVNRGKHRTVTVKIPPSGKAGATLRVVGTNGVQHTIVIPKGKKAGDLMEVEMPEPQWPVLAAPDTVPTSKRPPKGHVGWIAPAEWRTDRDNATPKQTQESRKARGILRGLDARAYLVDAPRPRSGLGKLAQLPRLPPPPSLSLPSLSLPSLPKVTPASGLPGLLPGKSKVVEEIKVTDSGVKIVPLALLTSELYKEETGRAKGLQIRNITLGLGLGSESGMLDAARDADARRQYDEDDGGSDSVMMSHDYD